MLQKEGLYLLTSPNNNFPTPETNVLAIVVDDSGKTIWLRNFVDMESALNVLDQEALEDFDHAAIEAELKKQRAYFTEIESREDGYKDHSFQKYALQQT